MITVAEKCFILETSTTSYIFRITEHGHLEHVFYGARIPDITLDDTEALSFKRTAQAGSTVAYTQNDLLYSLDRIPFEWSGIGKGDYRFSPTEMRMPDGGYVSDFIYDSHEINEGILPMRTLPTAMDDSAKYLKITLKDTSTEMYIHLVYTVFQHSDVITRRVILENRDSRPVTIRRVLSMMLDMPNQKYYITTLAGDWAKEAHRHTQPLQPGMFVNESRTGASSNKHNPGILISESDTTEDRGLVYGFNLVYSGNHFSFVELGSHGLVRVGMGISPHCFEWTLNANEIFETPEVAMTVSNRGYNGASRQFHKFVNSNIVPKEWQSKPRPVLYNCWEPCFFKFNESRLLKLARRAKKLGMELFVLDDGWFGARDNDNAGLGDYSVNKKKFPRGLKHFADKLRGMGLEFGIWFEPEMVNPDSDLYRFHPEYAVEMPNRNSTLGRNQLVLDLSNPSVRDYIVENVTAILDETNAAYVKWDMNRHISEFYSPYAQAGEFFHKYILGLYDILRRIFHPRPHILLESCSSGGNRFDLGMLCFSPQIWTSDCTDPIERLRIQGGLSLLYPPSTMGAHVSDAPHQQTLRDTPLSTRFNAASFGVLGYELDLRFLSSVEKKEIAEQTAFYKTYRNTFQYGTFSRTDSIKENKVIWQIHDEQSAIVGIFQTISNVAESPDILRFAHLDPQKRYTVSTRPQRLFIKRFGGLVKHILPIALNPSGFILNLANRFHALTDCVESYEAVGATLTQVGIRLNNQFMGSHYNENTRLLGDFGSNLYVAVQQS